MSDPFGRAVRDSHRGEQEEPLVQRDGEETMDHPVEGFYFAEFEGDDWLDGHLAGPLLDLGCGAGRHARYYAERMETVAVDVSEPLVRTAGERSEADVRVGDMFSLREQFDRDQFRSVLSIGTQLGLVGSLVGLRRFLGDLAHVTTQDATAVVDNYDPAGETATELLGYREDPARGLAHRVFHFAYEGEVGEMLYFRLFSPERLADATVGTGWSLTEVDRDESGCHYRALLEKWSARS